MQRTQGFCSDIQYIKVEASDTGILNILTVLRYHRQLDHKRSCKRRSKDYINGPLSKKTICETKNESQCFFVGDSGVNRHKEYYQKNKEKMKNLAINYRNANRENVNAKRREKYCKDRFKKKFAQG